MAKTGQSRSEEEECLTINLTHPLVGWLVQRSSVLVLVLCLYSSVSRGGLAHPFFCQKIYSAYSKHANRPARPSNGASFLLNLSCIRVSISDCIVLFHKAEGPFTCRDLHVPPAAGVEGSGIVGISMNICGPIFVALMHVLSEVSVLLNSRVV